MELLEPDRITELLRALGERLALTRTPVELVVIGGSALTILGLVERPTQELLGALRYLGVEDAGLGD